MGVSEVDSRKSSNLLELKRDESSSRPERVANTERVIGYLPLLDLDHIW